MLIVLALSTGGAADFAPVPAAMVGVDSWEERTLLVADLRANAEDGQAEQIDNLEAVLELLKVREPEPPRQRLRELTKAALSLREPVRWEALHSATHGTVLPTIPEGEGWFHRSPWHVGDKELPSVRLAGITVGDLAADSALTGALEELFRSAGWKLEDSAPITFTGAVVDTFGATWEGSPGTAASVQWKVAKDGNVVFDATTRAFTPGLVGNDSGNKMIVASLSNVLAQQSLVGAVVGEESEAQDDPEFERAADAEVCFWRKKHQDATALRLQLGRHWVGLAPTEYACLTGPTGMEVKVPGAYMTPNILDSEAPVVVELRHGDSPGMTTLSVTEKEAFDKLVSKGKLVELKPQLVPMPEE